LPVCLAAGSLITKGTADVTRNLGVRSGDPLRWWHLFLVLAFLLLTRWPLFLSGVLGNAGFVALNYVLANDEMEPIANRAETWLRWATALSTESGAYSDGLVIALMAQHREAEAFRALWVSDRSVEFLVKWGDEARRDKRHDEALRLYLIAAELANDRAEGRSDLYYRIGRIEQYNLGDEVGAWEKYELALMLDNFDSMWEQADLHFQRGVLQARQDHWAEAIIEYEQALALDPSHPRVRPFLADALYRTAHGRKRRK